MLKILYSNVKYLLSLKKDSVKLRHGTKIRLTNIDIS